MTLPKLFAAAALSLSLATPVPAQDRADPVVEMLSHIPQSAVDPRKLFQLQYGDPQAGRAPLLLSTGDPETAMLFATGRGLPTEVAQFLMVMVGASEPLVGFEMTEIRESASLSQPPALMTLYRLDDGIGGRVGPALDALGYARDTRAGLPVWARGEDHEIDIAARDPANPFGGALGRWGRVAVAGEMVAWSPSWAPIEGFAADATGMDADPRIAALVAALDAAAAGPGILVSAHFLVDPQAGAGSPAVMVTDMIDGAQDVSLLALVVPPGRDAAALRDTVARNWDAKVLPGMRTTMAELARAPADLHIVDGPPEVLIIRLSAPRDRASLNAAFGRAMNLVMYLDLAALLSE